MIDNSVPFQTRAEYIEVDRESLMLRLEGLNEGILSEWPGFYNLLVNFSCC